MNPLESVDNPWHHVSDRDGWHGVCSVCGPNTQLFRRVGAKSQGAHVYWMCANKERERNGPKQRKALCKQYGITVEEYDQMVENQNGVCAICEKPCASGRRLAVDHDHVTGKVRGLLCGACNRIIGHLDNKVWRDAALNYLEDNA